MTLKKLEPFLFLIFLAEGSLPTYYDVQEFFLAVPPRLSADYRIHTSSKGTRQAGKFDRHLHESFRLKRVIRAPGILRDLIMNVDRALLSCLHKFPPSDPSYNDFPSASNRERKLEHGRTGEVRSEYRVQLIYEEAVARFCAVVAGTLEFGLGHWKYGFLEWSRERLSNRRIPGVKLTDAVADGFLNLAETDEYGNHYHLTPRQRDVYKIFPELAIWEFKNLNFAQGEGEGEELNSAEVFNEIVNGFLTGIFPWEGCKEGEDCLLKHPKIGATACPMGYDALHSPCPSYDIARNEAIARQGRESQEDVQYAAIKTKKQDSARRILQQASGYCVNFKYGLLMTHG